MTTSSTPTDPAAAVLAAVSAVLGPLARLAVAKGVTAQQLEELLRNALVAAAQDAQPPEASSRQVSRIATATGLTRREVSRLLGSEPAPTPPRRSPATELFSRWLAAPEWRDPAGQPMALNRQGPAPSFEALAQSITRDVHPRSLLDELVRLGLAQLDHTGDTVRLLKERFVPAAGDVRQLGLLGHNVGDHLDAAVSNVIGPTPQHLEQAVFADGLSQTSLPRVRELVQAQWQSLVKALVPTLQQLIDADRDAGRTPTHRVRIGLYSFSAAAGDAPAAPTPPAPPSKRPGRASSARRRAAPRNAPAGDSHES